MQNRLRCTLRINPATGGDSLLAHAILGRASEDLVQREDIRRFNPFLQSLPRIMREDLANIEQQQDDPKELVRICSHAACKAANIRTPDWHGMLHLYRYDQSARPSNRQHPAWSAVHL